MLHGIGGMNKTCLHPFGGFSTHPNGSVSVCCQADMANPNSFARTNNKMLFLGQSSIDDIRNSDSFNMIREEMLAGREPATCKRCYDTERLSGTSKRIEDNRQFNWTDNVVSSLQFIELRLGNTCNLACITCNSVSSSKWLKDEKALEQKIEWFKSFENSKQTRWFESEEFYENLATISKHVKKIYINGGEPLLIKQHKVLLQKLVELDAAKDIIVEYSINLTITDTEFIDLWKQFKHVVVQFSIDATGEVNDFIRWGSKFEDIVKNLEWFIANKPNNTHYMVCQTLSAINYLEVPVLYEFVKKYSLDMYVNPVYSPSYFSAKSLTEQEKEQVRLSVGHLDERIKSTVNAWLDNNEYDWNEQKKMKEVLESLDELRGTNYKRFR